MKKIVLILALFFAIGMQANTIKEKHDINLDVKKVEMPEISGKYKCTTRTYVYTTQNPDGSYDTLVMTYIHCEPIE